MKKKIYIDNVRQSSLRSDDARCSQDESYEKIKIFEVNGNNRYEDYSSHIEAFVDKDVQSGNGGVVMKTGRVISLK